MPLLDVSDILGDPDFADEFIVIRRAETVNEYGESVVTQTEIFASGVVTAASGSILEQLPEGTRATGAILIHTQVRLEIVSATAQADRIRWAGNLYTVTNLSDYSRYGGGFVAAVCTLTDIVE